MNHSCDFNVDIMGNTFIKNLLSLFMCVYYKDRE